MTDSNEGAEGVRLSIEGDELPEHETGETPDVVSILFTLRDMAARAAESLAPQVEQAQKVLDALHAFADDAEDAACLVDASGMRDRDFGQALIPERADMVRKPCPTGDGS